MKKTLKQLMTVLLVSLFLTGAAFAGNSMAGHDMNASDKMGEMIHQSTVDGYMLSYHFMDLRDGTKAMENMEKPHHLMVYIMDKNHQPVLKGKVGFLIHTADGTPQKAMGMFMSNGFGTTVNMKKKGVYTITAKAVLDNKKLMDKFEYEIK